MFRREFMRQQIELEDKSLDKEVDVLNSLLKQNKKKTAGWLL